MNALRLERRQPRLIVLENVIGLLTANNGKDFTEVVGALVTLGYRVGSMVVDAERFVPQSRPRLFLIAIEAAASIPAGLTDDTPTPWTTMPALLAAHRRLPPYLSRRWLWWRLPTPPLRIVSLASVIEDDPEGVAWHAPDQTARVLSLMSPLNRARVEAERLRGGRSIGTIYRRTRPDGEGGKTQRAEVRFDGVAGCLRTPAGGSSRQTIIVIEDRVVRTRLIAAREAARLMGLPEDYELPARYNDAYHLLGDGVVATVVAHLSPMLLSALGIGVAKLAAAE
jgi:DNA (cytosine-5)-methyltransferase 1